MKSGRRRASVRVDPATPTGISLGVGAVLVLGAVLVAAPVPPVDAGWRLAIVAAAVAAFAALSVDLVALPGVVLIAWLLADGFLVNRLGELSWRGSSDMRRMVALAAAGAAGLLVGLAYRWMRAARSRQRFDAALQVLVTHVDEEETRDA